MKKAPLRLAWYTAPQRVSETSHAKPESPARQEEEPSERTALKEEERKAAAGESLPQHARGRKCKQTRGARGSSECKQRVIVRVRPAPRGKYKGRP